MPGTRDGGAHRALLDGQASHLGLLARSRSRVRRHVPPAWRRRLAVFAGGVLGGGARLAVSAVDGIVPWGTLIANVTGALLLGYLLTRFLAAGSRASLTVPLLCTGVLGSYTTFSALSLEVWVFVGEGRSAMAALYGIGSVVLGLLAAATGIRLAERRA